MKNEIFKKRLKEALDMKGIRPIALSKATGISKSLISRYLSGEVVPTQDKFQDIADYLNISYGWLLGYDVPMQNEERSHFELRQKIGEELEKATNDQLLKIYTYIKDIGV